MRLQDLLFMGAMGPPGGSKQVVTQRFLRHFNLISMLPFHDNTTCSIFSTIMDGFFRYYIFLIISERCSQKYLFRNIFKNINFRAHGFTGDVMLTKPIVSATLQIYKEAMRVLLPTPAKSHYIFNLRDFSRVILGVLVVRKETVPNKASNIFISYDS